MTKYEYATVPLLSHATKQILDTWGSDGWELVQVIPAPGTGEQLGAIKPKIAGKADGALVSSIVKESLNK